MTTERLTPAQRAARVPLKFSIGDVTRDHLRGAIAAEIEQAERAVRMDSNSAGASASSPQGGVGEARDIAPAVSSRAESILRKLMEALTEFERRLEGMDLGRSTDRVHARLIHFEREATHFLSSVPAVSHSEDPPLTVIRGPDGRLGVRVPSSPTIEDEPFDELQQGVLDERMLGLLEQCVRGSVDHPLAYEIKRLHGRIDELASRGGSAPKAAAITYLCLRCESLYMGPAYQHRCKPADLAHVPVSAGQRTFNPEAAGASPAGDTTPPSTIDVDLDYRDVIEASERAFKRWWASRKMDDSEPNHETLSVLRDRVREELRFTCTRLQRERAAEAARA